MEIIKQFTGQLQEVWNSARAFMRSRAILAEAGEEYSMTELYPEPIGWRIWIHVIHTGATSDLLVAVADKDSLNASALYLSSCDWDIKKMMVAVSISVHTAFPETSWKRRRSILIYAGRMLSQKINLLSHASIEIMSCREEMNIEVRIQVNQYEALMDVEWIEETIEMGSSE